MKVFMDTEFTGLHKGTTLISIGLVAENGKSFYAELTDYDENQVNGWLQKNVIDNLILAKDPEYDGYGSSRWNPQTRETNARGTTEFIKGCVSRWLYNLGDWVEKVEEVEIWSDCLAYDWVLFNNLYGVAFNAPGIIYYIPFDICTVFKLKGIDPDISREKFISNSVKGAKHNALYDAKVIKACYEKLMKIEEEKENEKRI
ncbi:3'-5' exoribonuclease domain-containing protein [Carnobacterium maltaromaticum]|uniref:3'-5' exoribonuclease domain-containing protein n=1 Tax=Carnobacterium maltaromaticum TaxID=2751 RepID=UPI0039BE7EC7